MHSYSYFGLLCSLILGSVALSPWLGSFEAVNFWLEAFKIPCLRRIRAIRYGGMCSAAWLTVCMEISFVCVAEPQIRACCVGGWKHEDSFLPAWSQERPRMHAGATGTIG